MAQGAISRPLVVPVPAVDEKLLLRLGAVQPDGAKRSARVHEHVLVKVRYPRVDAIVSAVGMCEVKAWLKGQQPLNTLLRDYVAAMPPRSFCGPPDLNAG